MIRFLRFCLGGIFFFIGITIMDKKDVTNIFVKTLQKKEGLTNAPTNPEK